MKVKDYCAIAYDWQVGTSGAGTPPAVPGLLRSTPSVTMQKFRTPDWLNESGAELPTKVTLAVPPEAKPAARKE